MSTTRKQLKRELTKRQYTVEVLRGAVRDLLPIAMVTASRTSKTYPEFTATIAGIEGLFPGETFQPAIKSRKK